MTAWDEMNAEFRRIVDRLDDEGLDLMVALANEMEAGMYSQLDYDYHARVLPSGGDVRVLLRRRFPGVEQRRGKIEKLIKKLMAGGQ